MKIEVRKISGILKDYCDLCGREVFRQDYIHHCGSRICFDCIEQMVEEKVEKENEYNREE